MARKKSRRGHDEGSIYEYPEGSGVWYAQLPPDAETGERPKRRARSQKEAIQKLRELEQQRTAGHDIRAQYPLLSEELLKWADETKKPKVSAKTWYSYRQTIQLYIIPNLPKRLTVDKLRAKHVEEMRNKIMRQTRQHQEEGGTKTLSVRTVNLSLFIIKSAMDTFMKRYNLPRNEALLVESLPSVKASIVTLSEEQVTMLMEEIETHRLKLLYVLAFTFGFRIGELLAIRPIDVDLNVPDITISGTLEYIPKRGLLRKDRPKTQSSIRTLPLSEELVELYRVHIQNIHAEFEARGETYREEGKDTPLFPSEAGTWLWPRNFTTHFKRVLKRAGLPFTTRPHDIRHTMATMMINKGHPLAVVSKYMGHSSIRVTADIYTHRDTTAEMKIVSAMGDLLKKKKKEEDSGEGAM